MHRLSGKTPRGGLADARWLVSVRNLAEAQLVSEFGVDIVDMKEPGDGPLAPVTQSVWESVATEFSPQTPGRADELRLSAALGEHEQAVEIAGHLPAEFAFAKVGPSDCPSEDRLEGVWREVRLQMPHSVELVAVAYADHRAAGALPAEQILGLASRMGFRRILIDTFVKDGVSSIETLGHARLAEFGRHAKQASLWWSLAGAIQLGHVRQLAFTIPDHESRPDCMAVRGDVCDGRREGKLCRTRLQAWRETLNQVNPHAVKPRSSHRRSVPTRK